MKIVVDIGHPAHVHYFRNCIQLMQSKGHEFLIIARDKEVTFDLLNYYKLPYSNRGKGKKGFFGKMSYILVADRFIYKKARQFKPDVFLSFGSPYAAHVAWLMGKPHIAFDDTDNNFFEHLLYVPFTPTIITPKVYQKDYKAKHIRFDGFMELSSLHPATYKPELPKNKVDAQINRGDFPNNQGDFPNNHGDLQTNRYIVMRFVSWQASHDIGLTGLSLKAKYELVKQLSKHVKIVISSESPLPDDLKAYAFSTHPAYMHDLVAHADLLISESLTMAAEASFLGTPAVCISTAKAGTLDEEVNMGLIELFRSEKGLLERCLQIVSQADFKSLFKENTQKKVAAKLDLTRFMVWFITNYPNSQQLLREHPNMPLDNSFDPDSLVKS